MLKIGVENINSNLATAIRTVVVLIMISAIVFFRNEFKNLSEISLRTWIFLTISGISTGLSWIFILKPYNWRGFESGRRGQTQFGANDYFFYCFSWGNYFVESGIRRTFNNNWHCTFNF